MTSDGKNTTAGKGGGSRRVPLPGFLRRKPRLHTTYKLLIPALLVLLLSVSMNLYTVKEGYYKQAEGEVFDRYSNVVQVLQPDKPLFPLTVQTIDGPLTIPVDGKLNIFVPQYVNCPDICHYETMIMLYVMNRTIAEGLADDIVWITIEVDPEGSNPDAARAYMRGMARDMLSQVDWRWILDTPEKMQRVYLLFEMMVQKDQETGLVGHTAGFFIVTPQGWLLYYVKPRTWEDPVGVGNALFEIIRNALGNTTYAPAQGAPVAG